MEAGPGALGRTAAPAGAPVFAAALPGVPSHVWLVPVSAPHSKAHNSGDAAAASGVPGGARPQLVLMSQGSLVHSLAPLAAGGQPAFALVQSLPASRSSQSQPPQQPQPQPQPQAPPPPPPPPPPPLPTLPLAPRSLPATPVLPAQQPVPAFVVLSALSEPTPPLPPQPLAASAAAPEQSTNHRKRHVCQFCGMAFGHRNALAAHRRVHTGERPFRCSEPGCNAAFTQQSNLRRHLDSHAGRKRFICPRCHRAFARNATLRAHLSRVHGEQRGDEAAAAEPQTVGPALRDPQEAGRGAHGVAALSQASLVGSVASEAFAPEPSASPDPASSPHNELHAAQASPVLPHDMAFAAPPAATTPRDLSLAPPTLSMAAEPPELKAHQATPRRGSRREASPRF